MEQEKTFPAAALQWDVVRGDVDANLGKAVSLIAEAAERGARLVVLPEMWATSFMGDDGPAKSRDVEAAEREIAGLAEKLSLVVVGSNYEFAGDKTFNRATVHDGGRLVGTYRKVHLFSPLGEDRWFTPGDDLLVVETSVAVLGVAICYDLRFPELIRLLGRLGAECLAVCSQWPEARSAHFRRLAQVRALENQCWFVGSNRCGVEPSLVSGRDVLYPGNSLIVDPTGQIIAEGNGEEGVVEAEVDLKQNVLLRRAIPVEKDRREDTYRRLWNRYWNTVRAPQEA